MRAGLAVSDAPHATADAAYQGVPGAFSEEAARSFLGVEARLVPCPTLEATFAALAEGTAPAAVVPIENSLAGPVPGCADLLARHEVHIVAEGVMRIAHALVAPPGVGRAAVRRVLSHPVAIAQCEAFFRRNPQVTPVPTFDTAGAVAEVVRERASDAAAIASARAAALYGAVILERDIQDQPDNFTRFLQISPGPAWLETAPGRKTSLFCVLPNVPGALASALALFASRGLNLTRIESRPVRATPFEYAFHLDVASTADPIDLGDALAALRLTARQVRVLGHYPMATAGRPVSGGCQG